MPLRGRARDKFVAQDRREGSVSRRGLAAACLRPTEETVPEFFGLVPAGYYHPIRSFGAKAMQSEIPGQGVGYASSF
jgi:hypothetical protein